MGPAGPGPLLVAWGPGSPPLQPRHPCRQDGGDERADCQGCQRVAQLEGQSPPVREVVEAGGQSPGSALALSGK